MIVLVTLMLEVRILMYDLRDVLVMIFEITFGLTGEWYMFVTEMIILRSLISIMLKEYF